MSGGLLKMGDHSYGDPQILVWGNHNRKVVVGKYSSIAKGCKILLHGDHNVDWITTYPFRKFRGTNKQAAKITDHPTSKGDVIIGHDVWIGRDCTILSGVKINHGAVVGARSVVTKDVEPYAIVAGNPARFIRKRFSEDQIKALLEIKWWNWPTEKIFNSIDMLSCNKIEEFIQKHGHKD